MSYVDNRNSAVRAIDEREMQIFRDMNDAGVKLAVPAALHYCDERQFAPPPWLTIAALELLCELLKRERSTKRGRSGGTIARYHQDMIDMVRWNQVEVLREKQRTVHQSLVDYSSLADTIVYQEELDRGNWLGRSFRRACECAAEMLERTEAFGSVDTIKRSYRDVARNMRDRKRALRYHILHPLFLRRVAIDHDLGYGHGAKVSPWKKRRRAKVSNADPAMAVSRET